MHNREFGRRVLSTDTIRRMDREELEEEMDMLHVSSDEEDSDDQLRDRLVDALTKLGHGE